MTLLGASRKLHAQRFGAIAERRRDFWPSRARASLSAPSLVGGAAGGGVRLRPRGLCRGAVRG
jgi:hypothetical protein